MKSPLETTVLTRARRERVQEKAALMLARLTAQSGRMLFVSDELLVRRLGLAGVAGRNPTYRIRDAFRKLHRKGFVTYRKTPNGWTANLTQEGKRYAKKLELEETIQIKKPKHWDGRWRVVIFDIWERRRPMRDKLRHMLKKAGFYKIQNSVWVHPYDCEELISFLRVDMRLGRSVVYLIAEGIEQDQRFLSHFDLL